MMAAKAVAITAAAQDKTRESHAKEVMGRQIRPKILDEEFPDYEKLLDKAEVEPPLTPTRPHYSPGNPLHSEAYARWCAT